MSSLLTRFAIVAALIMGMYVPFFPTAHAQETVYPTRETVKGWGQNLFGVYQPQRAAQKELLHPAEFFVFARSAEPESAVFTVPDNFPSAEYYIFTLESKVVYQRGPTRVQGFRWIFLRLEGRNLPEGVTSWGLTTDQVKSWGLEVAGFGNAPDFFVWNKEKGKDITVPEVITSEVRYYWFSKNSTFYGEGPGVMNDIEWGFITPTPR